MYDKNNIFAKIISGEIPSEKIYEDDHLIAINDINPVASVHILVITKGQYVDFQDFSQTASATEITHYFQKLSDIAIASGALEYRLVSNNGASCGQSVFHFHTHIIGGPIVSASLIG